MQTIQRRMNFLAVAAVFAAGASLCVAQNIASSGPAEPSYTQLQPAPIERAYPNPNNSATAGYGAYGQVLPDRGGPIPAAPVAIAPGGSLTAASSPETAYPIPGVILRVAPGGSVKDVVSGGQKLELRVDSGIANIDVRDPGKDIVLLVDLPGGQTQMLKNGLYTFNAATNTARVLKGEALAFPASAPNTKPLKVKEYDKIEFGKDARPHEFVPQQAIADLIPAPPDGGAGYGYGPGHGYGPGYGYGPYGDGFYGSPYGYYPYYGFAGPYYPYGFYPYYGIGFGFGYFGRGFYGGGFRGRR